MTVSFMKSMLRFTKNGIIFVLFKLIRIQIKTKLNPQWNYSTMVLLWREVSIVQIMYKPYHKGFSMRSHSFFEEGRVSTFYIKSRCHIMYLLKYSENFRVFCQSSKAVGTVHYGKKIGDLKIICKTLHRFGSVHIQLQKFSWSHCTICYQSQGILESRYFLLSLMFYISILWLIFLYRNIVN